MSQKRQRPNILFIMADDHAARAIGCYGHGINRTPHIDRIAREGVRLDHCYVSNSICTPSRAAILTGTYNHVNGVMTLDDGIDNRLPNVAKHLRSAGYQTAIVGKWHLGEGPAHCPTGFDHWSVVPGQGDYFDPVFHEAGGTVQRPGYVTDVITEQCLQWLEARDPQRPFFLMCHHKAPHREWTPSAKYKDLFKDVEIPEPDNLYDEHKGRAGAAERSRMRVGQDSTKTDLKMDPPPGLEGNALRKWAYQVYIKDYLRCVQSVDDNVGRVLDYLDEDKIADDTIIIYNSDQGFFLGDHGWYDKRFMYEECLRTPLLVRWPGHTKPGTVNTDMALNLDFAPTFLDAAGAPVPKDMQGVSLKPLLNGKTPKNWRTEMYYRYWMHLGGGHNVTANYGIRTQRYKLIYYYGKALGSSGAVNQDTPPEWEFFDLKTDPREMKNLYNEPGSQKIIAQLKLRLAKLQAYYKDTPA
jgi:arylsulfatase A-like enzyme